MSIQRVLSAQGPDILTRISIIFLKLSRRTLEQLVKLRKQIPSTPHLIHIHESCIIWRYIDSTDKKIRNNARITHLSEFSRKKFSVLL
jgi:hypothetical protein